MPILGDGLIKRRSSSTGALLTNLISFWELGEASGTRNDSKGSNNLTDNNTVGQAAGKVGNAASFASASSQFLSVSNAAFNPAQPIAVFCWFQLTSNANSFYVLISKNTTTTNRGYDVYFQKSDSKLYFEFRNSADTAWFTTNWGSALSLNTWYSLYVHYDTANSQIGISVDNGTLVTASATSARSTSNAFVLGGIATQYWTGYIDQFGFWQRILTTTERTFLHNSGNGRSYAEVAAY